MSMFRSRRSSDPGASPASERSRYPALHAWRVAHDEGVELPDTHPLARAACHEANAAEFDRLAVDARSLADAGALKCMAYEEIAESIAILAEAERRARDEDADAS